MARDETVSCPKCGASVRKSRLRRHMSKVHREELVSAEERPRARPGKWRRRLARNLTKLAMIGLAVLIAGAGVYYVVLNPPSRERLPVALFDTDLGSFKVELNTEKAPITAGNFIDLVERGFYNGLTFHRVAQGFVIQGGDPWGNGTGGSGRTIPWEDTSLKNLKYTIAMARGQDPDSASSQFYINLKDNPSLDQFDPPFVVFGKVIEGFETVDRIGSLYPPGSDSYDGPPTSTVTMNVSIVR